LVEGKAVMSIEEKLANLPLELVPLGIDHVSHLNFVLQDTKQTISIIQG
jgi:hypothetical protein